MPRLWLPIAALLSLGVLASAQTVEKDIAYGPDPSQKLDLHARKLGNEAEYRVLAGETHYSLIRGLDKKGSAAFDIIVRFVKGRPLTHS